MPPPTPLYLAEAQASFRELLREHLNKIPRYKVLGEGDNGEHVLKDCLKLRPTLLVMDIHLSGLDALEVCHSLMERQPTLRIIIFTVHFDPPLVRRMLSIGVRAVVEKNLSLGILLSAIDTVADGGAYFSPAVHQYLRQLSGRPHRQQTGSILTERETEVLRLVSLGKSSRQIARELGVSPKTAENHRHNLMRKLNAHNSADVTREAYRQGLLCPE